MPKKCFCGKYGIFALRNICNAKSNKLIKNNSKINKSYIDNSYIELKEVSYGTFNSSD